MYHNIALAVIEHFHALFGSTLVIMWLFDQANARLNSHCEFSIQIERHCGWSHKIAQTILNTVF